MLGYRRQRGHSLKEVANNRQLGLEGKGWALCSPETGGYFPLINNRPQEMYSDLCLVETCVWCVTHGALTLAL